MTSVQSSSLFMMMRLQSIQPHIQILGPMWKLLSIFREINVPQAKQIARGSGYSIKVSVLVCVGVCVGVSASVCVCMHLFVFVCVRVCTQPNGRPSTSAWQS